MDELRRSIAGLRSPGLGDRSLRDALQTICVDFGERTGIEITWRLEDCVDRLRPAHAETIWRVVQEALTNVEKHADAQYVQLTLICEQESVTLQVEDDGVGVPGDAEMAPDQFGLRGMRERVEGLGGSLNVLNTGSGTRIDVSLPVVFELENIPLVN
jgi:signal transduction histidine kinase